MPRVSIILGGNCPGGIIRGQLSLVGIVQWELSGGQLPRWQLSRGQLSGGQISMGQLPRGKLSRGNCPVPYWESCLHRLIQTYPGIFDNDSSNDITFFLLLFFLFLTKFKITYVFWLQWCQFQCSTEST